MATGASTFSTLISTTLQNFSNKLLDSVVTNNALAYMLYKSGNIKVVDGGRSFVRQLLYRTNASFAARGSLDTIALENTDPVTASNWPIRVLSGGIFLPFLEVAMNSGSKEKLLDYANVKKEEAVVSMGEILGDQVFGSSTAANDFNGLQVLISEDPTSQTDVGGINPQTSDNGYWRNYSYNTAVTAFGTTNAGFNAIDTSINNSTFGKAGPTFIVTTTAIWTLFQLALTTNMRYASMDLPVGKAGFKALEYINMPVIFDDNCPAGNLYGVDTNGISMNVLSEGNMKMTPFQNKQDQLGESALMYLFGNLTMGSRRTNFVVDSITA